MISQHLLRATRLLFLLTALLATATTQAANAPGEMADDFTLKSRSGENLRLAEQRGQVLLINFWASWCGPCRQEMPLLDALHQRYESLGVAVWGINVDDDPAKAEKILKDIPVSFPVLFDPDSAVSKRYGVDSMPTTVLVDRNGKVRFRHRGYKSGYEKEYEKQIKELLKE